MHCVTLADLAAMLSHHGPTLLIRRTPVSDDTLVEYWTASRNRFEHWNRSIAMFRDADRSGDWALLSRQWSEQLIVLEEILVTEILTRVVAALGSCIDDQAKRDDSQWNSDCPKRTAERISPITHGVFLSHLEISNRVHQMILARRGCHVQHMVRLNRLRRGVQRWNDLLIGRLSLQSPRQFSYSFETDRARTFSEEIRDCGHDVHRETTSWLMNAAMRDTLMRRTSETAASPEANQDVASSVLRIFRPELFDSLGFPKSMWLHRMELDERGAERFVPQDQAAI